MSTNPDVEELAVYDRPPRAKSYGSRKRATEYVAWLQGCSAAARYDEVEPTVFFDLPETNYFLASGEKISSKTAHQVRPHTWDSVIDFWVGERAAISHEPPSDVGVSRAKPFIESYESAAQELRKELATLENEKCLSKAYEERELMGALIGHDWLGLKIVSLLAGKPRLQALEISAALDVAVNKVAAVLAHLTRFKALAVEASGAFACTDLGMSVCAKLADATD
ncbi:MAG: hypothetical protein GY769_02975 [bacterium]|nr:hypothetical protein [bacterium]